MEDFNPGDRVLVSDPEGSKLEGTVEGLFGFNDLRNPLWSVRIDGADQSLPIPSSAIKLYPSDPLDQMLARDGLARADVPALFAEQGIATGMAMHLLETDPKVASYFIREGIRLRMRKPEYGPVSVVYCSRASSSPGIGTAHIVKFSTTSEALAFCRASVGRDDFKSAWIQPARGRETIWSPDELERELAS